MNEAERIWSEKSDEDLLEAAAELRQFTEEGQRIIRAELKRRGLEDPVEQAAGEAGDGEAEAGEADAGEADAGEAAAEEPECLRCRVRLLLIDPNDPDSITRWGWLGGLRTPTLGRDGLDVYICPRCGHVEFFAEPPEEEEPEDETDEGQEPPTGADAWK